MKGVWVVTLGDGDLRVAFSSESNAKCWCLSRGIHFVTPVFVEYGEVF